MLPLRHTLPPRAFLTATVMMSPMVHCVPDFWMHCTSLAPELSDTCGRQDMHQLPVEAHHTIRVHCAR